ncbi:MAG: hypothetical protein NTX56_11770, partial [Proteobacteria bacterium]|nr:hypothetical protein [Pseudomonadota bacterium]
MSTNVSKLASSRKAGTRGNANSSSVWCSDFSVIEPTIRRTARYALQMLNSNALSRDDNGDGSNSITWTLIAPLLNTTAIGAARRARMLAGDENDSVDSSNTGPISWATLTNLPAGLLERLAREDGDEPTCPTVAVMAKIFCLDKAETFILDFLEKRFSIKEFRMFLRHNKQVDLLTNVKRLAGYSGLDVATIRSALAKNAMLRKLKLVELHQGYNDLEDFLGPSEGLRDILQAAPATESELMDMLVEVAPAPEWTLDAFPHLKNHATRLTG